MNKPADLVGVYCRVSTADQAASGHSLERQEEILRNYAAARWPECSVIVRADVGSGRKTARQGYRHLMGLAGQRRLRALLAVDVSRLWRNIRDAVIESAKLRELGCDLVLWSQGVDTATPVGRVSFALIAALAAFESEQTGERVKRSFEVAREQGRKGPGKRPYGWDVQSDGKLQRNAHEQGVLDLVDGLRRKGLSWDRIADDLESRRLSTVSGRPWSGAGIRLVFGSAMRHRAIESERSFDLAKE